MAAKNQQNRKSEKRKQIGGDAKSSASKKTKFENSKSANLPRKRSEKLSEPSEQHEKPKPNRENPGPEAKRESRLRAKELAEARKKKRKRHYTLEQELASRWEKMRRRNIAKEDRSKLVSEALQKMKGKIPEIAGSHVSSRVLQTCVKHCSQAERDSVFEELQPHFLALACNTYAVHLVKKMLDNASKKQLARFISVLHGHVASLLRHMVGSVVIEHAYQLGDAAQKLELVTELYSTEFQLFKDMIPSKESKLLALIPKLGLQKNTVLRHMASVIQPILEKGIVDHSIIHRALMEYLSIADKFSASDIIQQLSGPLLVRMIHTRDGCTLGMLCLKYGSPKERKKIIKGMKGHIGKIAHDQYGSMMLVCVFSVVDDTRLITKVVIRELEKIMKELVLNKSGRRPLLQLLRPNCSRYFNPDDLASLGLSIPSLSTKDDQNRNSKNGESGNREVSSNIGVTSAEDTVSPNPDDSVDVIEGGKKDPTLRRLELLVNSGLAKSLVDTCIENAREFLTSNFGKDILYEVAMGAAGGILHTSLNDQINVLHKTVASLAAEPKSETEEHVLENFHSSRIIRKLALDCSAFAATLWKTALEGKCEMWAKGHSQKVVCAFLETSDSEILELAKGELQPLIDDGTLKLPEIKQLVKKGTSNQ